MCVDFTVLIHQSPLGLLNLGLLEIFWIEINTRNIKLFVDSRAKINDEIYWPIDVANIWLLPRI